MASTQSIRGSYGITPVPDYNTSGTKLRLCGGSTVIDERDCRVVINLAIDPPHEGMNEWHQNAMLRAGSPDCRPRKVYNKLFKEDWDHQSLGLGTVTLKNN